MLQRKPGNNFAYCNTDCQHPARPEGSVHLPEVLGFKEDERIHWYTVEISKRRLECWWKTSKEEIDRTGVIGSVSNGTI